MNMQRIVYHSHLILFLGYNDKYIIYKKILYYQDINLNILNIGTVFGIYYFYSFYEKTELPEETGK